VEREAAARLHSEAAGLEGSLALLQDHAVDSGASAAQRMQVGSEGGAQGWGAVECGLRWLVSGGESLGSDA
jgi:hypothetical protein